MEQLRNKETQLLTKKQKLEADKEILLATINDDIKALRERRDELEPKLADFKSVVLETESSVSEKQILINCIITSIYCYSFNWQNLN